MQKGQKIESIAQDETVDEENEKVNTNDACTNVQPPAIYNTDGPKKRSSVASCIIWVKVLRSISFLSWYD